MKSQIRCFLIIYFIASQLTSCNENGVDYVDIRTAKGVYTVAILDRSHFGHNLKSGYSSDIDIEGELGFSIDPKDNKLVNIETGYDMELNKSGKLVRQYGEPVTDDYLRKMGIYRNGSIIFKESDFNLDLLTIIDMKRKKFLLCFIEENSDYLKNRTSNEDYFNKYVHPAKISQVIKMSNGKLYYYITIKYRTPEGKNKIRKKYYEVVKSGFDVEISKPE